MDTFFDRLRGYIGPLSQGQVDGANVILAATEGVVIKHRAYMLATAWHETDHTLQPIEEYGKGAGRAYGHPDGPWHKVYDGRGLEQLTWLRNYVFATTKLQAMGILKSTENLAITPDLAMRPDVAAAILRYGMEEGWFTGKKLSDFTDYLNMRRVINGMDKADLIAGYAIKFEDCLSAGWKAPEKPIPSPGTVSPAPAPKPVPAPDNGLGWLLSLIIQIIVTLFARKAPK